jgi:hypothetical protein
MRILLHILLYCSFILSAFGAIASPADESSGNSADAMIASNAGVRTGGLQSNEVNSQCHNKTGPLYGSYKTASALTDGDAAGVDKATNKAK